MKLFTNEKGIAKLEIGLCRGKKTYDKRESLKEQDTKRDLERIKKEYWKSIFFRKKMTKFVLTIKIN